MKKLKAVTALILALVLTAGIAACGEKAPEVDTSSALAVMRSINTTLPQTIDDKYRTFYEVFVYSFYDSDGDGIGDLPGLTEKLDYINDGDAATDTDLGATGIWLMPIMPSPSYHKYDVTDYYDIDPQYGTLEDFKTFIAAAHERGINVIIDLVMNHTSSEHPWFKEAADYLRTLPAGAEPDLNECPYVAYYNFSREVSTCQLPGTDWYYEAPFWSGMPDLDLQNVAVRGEIEDIVDFWLELGVDGFRLDAAKEFVSGATQANTEILSWFNDMVKSKKDDAYIVAEVWTGLDTYAQYYASGIDSCFDFAFGDGDGVIPNVVKHTGSTASSYGKAIETLEATLSQYNPDYIDAPFYVNHDMGRSAGHYFDATWAMNQFKMGQALNLMMSGASFTYYGEELGMKGSGKDENKRAAMYWSADSAAQGMCSGPSGMDSFEMKYPDEASQAADGDSILNFVIQAMRVRTAFPAIARGTTDFVEELSDDNVCVITKTWGDEQVMLVFNISQEPQTVDLAGSEFGKLSAVLVTTAEAPALTDGSLSVPVYSVAVLTK